MCAAAPLERAARTGVREYIKRGREAGMTWHQVGEALGLEEIVRARGSGLDEAAFEFAADRSAFQPAALGTFAWTCPDCGELVRDGDRAGGARLRTSPGTPGLPAAAVAEWLAQGD